MAHKELNPAELINIFNELNRGIYWQLLGKVETCGRFQSEDTGDTIFYGSLKYMGGIQKLSLDKASFDRLSEYRGQVVRAGGVMTHTIDGRGNSKVKYSLEHIETVEVPGLNL